MCIDKTDCIIIYNDEIIEKWKGQTLRSVSYTHLHLDQAFELERIPFVILLGIFCGLISLYFTRAMNSVEGCLLYTSCVT